MRCAIIFITLLLIVGCGTPQGGIVTTNDSADVVHVDDRWHKHEDYLNDLLKAVQSQWWSILAESRLAPRQGSQVIITFKINSKGETDIVKVEDVGAGKLGVFSCQNAITYPQPYRKWTDQMISDLGEEQLVTIGFHFQ